MLLSPPATNSCAPKLRILASDTASICEASRQIAELAQVGRNDLGRRAEERVPFAKLIQCLPLDDRTRQPVADPIYIVGKHLATLGLDFFHHEPIPYRFAIVTLETGAERWVRFMMKITWCRFLKAGWYDGGGKFVKLVDWAEPGTSSSAI